LEKVTGVDQHQALSMASLAAVSELDQLAASVPRSVKVVRLSWVLVDESTLAVALIVAAGQSRLLSSIAWNGRGR
jgi:hypothetical protein